MFLDCGMKPKHPQETGLSPSKASVLPHYYELIFSEKSLFCLSSEIFSSEGTAGFNMCSVNMFVLFCFRLKWSPIYICRLVRLCHFTIHIHVTKFATFFSQEDTKNHDCHNFWEHCSRRPSKYTHIAIVLVINDTISDKMSKWFRFLTKFPLTVKKFIGIVWSSRPNIRSYSRTFWVNFLHFMSLWNSHLSDIYSTCGKMTEISNFFTIKIQ